MTDSFRKDILKVRGTRKHKVTNSNGVYDAYKDIRKNRWCGIGRPLTEKEFYSIIRKVNNCIADEIANGNDFRLPCRMGTIELRKYKATISIANGEVRTNLPVDWDRTLRLWAEDDESYKEKVLVRMEEKEIFKIFYNKGKANYNNKSFYVFKFNRDLKRRVSQQIKGGAVDAFTL